MKRIVICFVDCLIVCVVFVCVQMPVQDGLQATVSIRTSNHIPEDKQPFIIALTANAMQNDRTAAFEVGVDSFLSKVDATLTTRH